MWSALVLPVFGDESHDERTERVFSVTGLIGRQSDWDALELKWSDRTGGQVFHATDCNTDQGDYKNTGHDDNQTLYKDLTQLIAKSGLFGYSHTMDLIAEREAFGNTLLPDARYYWLFSKVVASCARYGYLCVPQETVEFTFDARLESNYNATQWYAYMQSLNEWEHRAFIADKISFATRKTVGIQIADLVAREAMKHLDNIIGPVKRPMRLSMKALNDTQRFGFRFYTGQYFSGFVKSLEDLENDPSFPVKRAAYGAWLKQRGLTDNHANRIQYFAYVDKAQRDQGGTSA